MSNDIVDTNRWTTSRSMAIDHLLIPALRRLGRDPNEYDLQRIAGDALVVSQPFGGNADRWLIRPEAADLSREELLGWLENYRIEIAPRSGNFVTNGLRKATDALGALLEDPEITALKEQVNNLQATVDQFVVDRDRLVNAARPGEGFEQGPTVRTLEGLAAGSTFIVGDEVRRHRQELINLADRVEALEAARAVDDAFSNVSDFTHRGVVRIAVNFSADLPDGVGTDDFTLSEIESVADIDSIRDAITNSPRIAGLRVDGIGFDLVRLFPID